MKTEALIRDPIFQLNILLWMAKEQPSDNYYVRPLFYELGYSIIYIEHPFAFPEETSNAMKDSGLDISTAQEPDLILGRKEDNKALYFEAKANSFFAASTSSRQARAHLVASGPVFSEVLAPLDSCLLCYVVPKDGLKRMSECLTTLTTELMTKELKPGLFSCHGLTFDGKQLVYSWDSAFKAHVGLTEDMTSVLNNIDEDTDSAPLVLVFSDEDCSNTETRDFYRRVVIDQVRACLLCTLRSLPVGARYETTPDSILRRTTDGVFDYLGRVRQGGLRRLVRQNVLRRIYDHWKDRQSGVGFTDDRLTITWQVIGEKEDFLDWLEDRRLGFAADRPPEEPLFDHLDDDSEVG